MRRSTDRILTTHVGALPAPLDVWAHPEVADDRLRGRAWRLRDLLGPAVYERQGTEMANDGLFLDMPAWGYHVFELSAA